MLIDLQQFLTGFGVVPLIDQLLRLSDQRGDLDRLIRGWLSARNLFLLLPLPCVLYAAFIPLTN